MQSQWFETFFQGVAVEFWRRVVTPEMTAADAGFLDKALQPPPGGRLLDAPCGDGRHAREFARRGCRVTGVDLSADCLAAARAASAAESLAVEWHQGDMRDLPWQAEFDGAYCFGNSFGYLDHAGARVFLSAIARALKPGARFALDVGTVAESILPSLQPRRWHRAGDLFMLSECRYEASASRLDIDYTFIRDGVAETRPTSSYVYTVAELGRLCREAGLEVVSLSGSVSGEPYKLGSPHLLLVARRS